MTASRSACRPSQPDLLSPSVRERIQALPTLDMAELRAEWRRAWGAPPPKGVRRRFLMLGVAWRWQADHLGGLSPGLRRRLDRLARGAGDHAPAPAPGARLIREWRGARYEVEVVEQGYLFRGARYRSLSGVAKAITGVARNGPAFFGLREQRPHRP